MLDEKQRHLLKARDAFVSGDPFTGVRAETVRSWERSRQAGVDHDTPLSLLENPNFDPESALRRAIEPVATALTTEIGSESVGVLSVDDEGTIVGRWFGSNHWRSYLDDLGTEEGTQFEEGSTGTTGLGTVLEDRAVAVVEGAEHFKNVFDGCVAVGAPIVNPATGRIAGAMDIVCPVGSPPGLIKSLIERAAREVTSELVTGFAAADRGLLDQYHRLERRGPRRPVIAVNRRIMLANRGGGDLLSFIDADGFWQRVEQILADGGRELTLDLPEMQIRGNVTPFDSGRTREYGAIVQFPQRAYQNWRRADPAPAPGAPVKPNLEKRPDMTRSHRLIRRSTRPLTPWEQAECDAVLASLEQHRGNKRAAAAALGIARSTLHRKIAEWGFDI